VGFWYLRCQTDALTKILVTIRPVSTMLLLLLMPPPPPQQMTMRMVLPAQE
jgi:hypothetical protein